MEPDLEFEQLREQLNDLRALQLQQLESGNAQNSHLHAHIQQLTQNQINDLRSLKNTLELLKGPNLKVRLHGLPNTISTPDRQTAVRLISVLKDLLRLVEIFDGPNDVNDLETVKESIEKFSTSIPLAFYESNGVFNRTFRDLLRHYSRTPVNAEESTNENNGGETFGSPVASFRYSQVSTSSPLSSKTVMNLLKSFN